MTRLDGSPVAVGVVVVRPNVVPRDVVSRDVVSRVAAPPDVVSVFA